uniref:Uncharacterized protein n=1 Tax=Arundo donax TaxID=35708 RepID=A0A0A9H9Z2_ARUDO
MLPHSWPKLLPPRRGPTPTCSPP